MNLLLSWLIERLEAGSKPVMVVTWAAILIGTGVALGIMSALVLLGFWPFLKFGEWLLG